MGYPLSQTLFTSVHLDRLLWPEPKRLADADFLQGLEATAATALLREVVRPYCLGLIKSCDLVLDMVTSQHYYEVSFWSSPRIRLRPRNSFRSGRRFCSADVQPTAAPCVCRR